MARKARGVVEFPAWRYGPNGEAEIFNAETEVPFGWTKQPGQVFVPREGTARHDRADLIKQLEEAGITVNPTWSAAHMKKVLDDSSTSR